MSNIVKLENEPMYSPGVHHGHRYSMSGDAHLNNGSMPPNGSRPGQPHSGQLHSQTLPAHQWDYRKLSNRMTPTVIRTEMQPQAIANNNLSSTQLQASPSTVSPAESSPRDPTQAHNAYNQPMQGAAQSFAVVQKPTDGTIHYQQYPQAQPHQQVHVIPPPHDTGSQTIATISPQSQTYQSPALEQQQQQMLYDQMGYQEPVGVVQAQHFNSLPYSYGVTASVDMYKPEDYDFGSGYEHMMPSQRVMNGY